MKKGRIVGFLCLLAATAAVFLTAAPPERGEMPEETVEVLPGSYDFDHDGQPETVERTTVWYPGRTGEAAERYEVCLRRRDGTPLYREAAGVSHAEQNALYACAVDGRDYLLRYDPWMGQGCCAYTYQLFSLDAAGTPVTLREGAVEFDVNWGAPGHRFDPAAIAAFLAEVHGYLSGADALLDTTFGEVYLVDVDRQDAAALEEALRRLEAGQGAEETVETLPGSYDFDHDGQPETVEVAAVRNSEESVMDVWYRLRVRDGDGAVLWEDTAAHAHPGWVAFSACAVDGWDYLLRYRPTMYQGWAEYEYQLFSLDGAGGEVPLQEGAVDFDLNVLQAGHQFDPAALTAFLWEVRGFLTEGTVLLSTLEGTILSGGPGLALLRSEVLGDLSAPESAAAMEEALRQLEEEQGV